MSADERGQNIWLKLTADMQRYTGPDLRPWSVGFLLRVLRKAHEHPGLIAIIVYRYGQWSIYRCRVPVLRQICCVYYYCWFNWVRTRLGIELPYSATIDGGLRLLHFGCIVHGGLVSGKGLSINHGVLIGATESGVPRFGDNVRLTAKSTVIGGVVLGDNVLVGAGAMVTKSFPANSVVVGVPARLLRCLEPQDQAGSHTGEPGP